LRPYGLTTAGTAPATAHAPFGAAPFGGSMKEPK
jgi:hypothetical protein